MSLVPILIKNEEQKGGWTDWNFLQWLVLGFITEGGSYSPEVVFEVERNVLLAYEYQSGWQC